MAMAHSPAISPPKVGAALMTTAIGLASGVFTVGKIGRSNPADLF